MLNIDKDYFINVCNNSKSMSEACSMLGLHFNTFKRYAIKFNCYNTNQSGKGLHKQNNGNKIELTDILSGKHPEYQTFKLKIRLISEGV